MDPEMMSILDTIKILAEEGENDYVSKRGKPIEEDIPSFVWIDSFISLAGSIMYDRENERQPNDIDIVVRAEEEGDGFKVVLDPALRLKMDRLMKARFGVIETQWIGSSHGPNWKYQPIYDLVLVPRKEKEIREINEPDFANEFYKREPRQELEQREVRIFEKKQDERIVSGVVYAPDQEDAQGDEATAEEIQKAAYDFMQNAQRYKAYHKGEEIMAKVLESYLAPIDFQMHGQNIKKGSWILTTRVEDDEIWRKIKAGEIIGYSMAGRATV